MSLADFAVTEDEFDSAIEAFLSKKCEKRDSHLVHKECGGAIRVGFLSLFYLREDDTLDPGCDGFGIGPKRVPYCERCCPPDGFNHTYALRFPILRERTQKGDYELIWGSRELESGDQRLLIE